MITIPCQKNSAGHFVPQGIEAEEAASEYKTNQPVTCKITGMSAKKERSVIALNLLMACCQLVSENCRNKHWDSKDKVKFQLKVELNFIDASKTIYNEKTGEVHLHYRSFSFDNLAHMESVKLFERAYPILAGHIETDVDTLISNAKDGMRSY